MIYYQTIPKMKLTLSFKTYLCGTNVWYVYGSLMILNVGVVLFKSSNICVRVVPDLKCWSSQ